MVQKLVLCSLDMTSVSIDAVGKITFLRDLVTHNGEHSIHTTFLCFDFFWKFFIEECSNILTAHFAVA